jgi:pyruvate,orthophosphate dikinase
VWANADDPRDAMKAREFGADGIGLCRTEHMFFEPDRLSLVQEMILAARGSALSPADKDQQERFHDCLGKLERLQVEDFEGLLVAMDGRPVVIRLLDPPLHEFLPRYEELLAEVIELRATGDDHASLKKSEALLEALGDMREENPMLGLRGCRVGLMYPAIYEMQTRAILRAAHNVGRQRIAAEPHIMVPLVSHANEMRQVRCGLEATIQKFREEVGSTVRLKIGTMIETPRAALTADEVAQSAEFFSFGTNDLTQMTFAFSRDDAEGKFLMRYTQDGVLPDNPFQTLDREGVGRLIEMACTMGRATRPDLELGICGEHGGDPASIAFFHDVGLDYVSCSPYRVPVARLAAAQAAIRSETTMQTEASAAQPILEQSLP